MTKSKKLHLSGGLLTICLSCLIAVSCNQNEMEKTSNSDESITASSFISSLDGNINSFMDAQVVLEQSDLNSTNHQTRSINDSFTRELYVNLSCVGQPVTLESVKTPRQILDLVKTTGAEISLINGGTDTHTLVLSEEECLSALNPLILESKRYLYSKGFTESEIQTMLKGNNVDESALVPFVLSLTEEEVYLQSNTDNNSSPTIRTVDLNRAGRCAVQALGFDALASFAQSNAKTWSKAVLKRVFKTVAARMVGPVGVTVTVIEFSLCYWG